MVYRLTRDRPPRTVFLYDWHRNRLSAGGAPGVISVLRALSFFRSGD